MNKRQTKYIKIIWEKYQCANLISKTICLLRNCCFDQIVLFLLTKLSRIPHPRSQFHKFLTKTSKNVLIIFNPTWVGLPSTHQHIWHILHYTIINQWSGSVEGVISWILSKSHVWDIYVISEKRCPNFW